MREKWNPTSDDALDDEVKESVLRLSVRRLDGAHRRSEIDVDGRVVGRQGAHVVVRHAPVHATVYRTDVCQRQLCALRP